MPRRIRRSLVGFVPFWLSASLLAQPAPPAAPTGTVPPADAVPPPVPPQGPAPAAPVPDEPAEGTEQDEPRAPDAPPVPPTQPRVPSDLPAAPPQPPGSPEPVVPRQPSPLANRPLATAPSTTEPDVITTELPPYEQSINVDGLVGFGVRIGGTDVTYSDTERVDVTFGIGGWYAPSRSWSFGLSYQRQGLGSDRTPEGEESFTADRDLDTVWLSGRLFFLRREGFRLFAELGAGLTWQQAHANGTHAGDFVNAPTVYSCGASDGPDPALLAGGGVDVDVERNIGFVSELSAAVHRTTSDMVGGCVPGVGSVVEPTLRVGFVYRFGL